MADLGNLWFSLGLDDSKFEKQWNAAFAKYKQQAKIDVGVQIAPTDLTQLNDIQNKLNAFANRFNGNTKAKIDLEVTPNTLQALQALKSLGGTKDDWRTVKEAAKALREVSKAATQAAIDQQKLNNQVAKGQKQVNSNYKVQSVWIQNLTNLASNYFSIYAVKNFVTELANVTGEFEKQRVTLQAMVGEMEGLDIYNKMKELSVVSPFQFKDLASYAKQLAAFSVPYNELYDTTKRLADVSAGLGVDMSRIILAYGQIRSAGVLKGTELRQLTEAGVPILEKLADKIYETTGKTVALGDVFDKVSQKAISFEMVKEVFEDMTSAGGKFYNMQEVQAETLSGKISNLKDAYAIMLTEMGDKTDGLLRGGVEGLYKLIDNWEKLGRVVIIAASSFGALQAVKIAQWAANGVVKISELNFSLNRLYKEARQTHGAFVSLFSAFAKANGIGLIITALAGLAAYFITARREAVAFDRELNKMLSSQSNKIKDEVAELDALAKSIKEANIGSKERETLIAEMNSKYGNYLENMLSEKNTANEVAEAHNKIANALKNRREQEALLSARQKVEDVYGANVDNLISKFEDKFMKRGEGHTARETAFVSEFIKKYIAQNPNIENLTELTKAMEKAGFDSKQIEDAFYVLVKHQTTGLDIFTNLVEATNEYNTKMEIATTKVVESFNATSFDSLKTLKQVEMIEAAYNQVLALINKEVGLTPSEREEKETKARISYLKALKDAYAGMPEKVKEYDQELKKLLNTEKGWRDSIAKDVEKLGLTAGFAPKADESYPKYIERIREEWELINKAIEKYNGKDVDGGLAAYTKKKDALLKLAKLWGIILDPKKDTKDSKEAERKRINALKDEYNWLVKVYEAYNQYRKQGLTDEESKKSVLADSPEMPELLKYAFEGDYDIAEWFRDEMGVLSREAAKNGSDIGQALALAIIQKLGGINYKEAIDVLKIKKDLDKELAKWGMEDFALKGEGVTLDISKILRDQFIADNEAAAKRDELLKQTAKLREQYGEDWYNSEVARINKLYNLEIGNNRKIAQDKINGLAKKSAEELMQSVGISPEFMSSLADKSIAQLKEAATKLRTLALGKIDVSDEVKKEAEKAKISIETLVDAIRAFLTGSEFEINAEGSEKMKKNLQSALSAAKELVSSLRALDKDNVALQGILDFAEMGLGMAESIAKGDYLAAAIQLVTGVINQIAAAKQYREEMEKAADSLTTSITASRRELKIAGEEFETIFGENLISALQADSEAISEISRELKTASSEVSKMKVVTRKGFFGIGVKQTTLKDLAPQLFKADGSVNYEYLDEFLEAYGDKLSDSQKTLLENLKNTYSQYENAMADTTEYLKGIFSDTASTIAERMMDSFAQTGDAATELGDLVSGVAKQMGQDLIESILLEQYLQPYMDRIKDLYNPNSNLYEADPTLRVQKAILAYQEGLSAIESGASEFNKIFQGIKDLGVDFSTGAENASQVLSGLTEDQQNLLVSYINAIRADVSMNKGMLTSIVNSVGTINNNIATAIVIWTQIEANTHRSADGVDRIIGFFESVMGPYDGGAGQAFQVNIA